MQANGSPIAGQVLRVAEVKDRANAWHRLKLTVRDGALAVAIDGMTVNRTSKSPHAPGRIVRRNQGGPMAFRNIIPHPSPKPCRPARRDETCAACFLPVADSCHARRTASARRVADLPSPINGAIAPPPTSITMPPPACREARHR